MCGGDEGKEGEIKTKYIEGENYNTEGRGEERRRDRWERE